ncbi:cell division protein FtsK [Actinosynnema sp. ALI-1.44]|uniref:cell division protein FtsK n=1 Tax=Actinosynnema sp. ALI-1.44 TaxID=1933779 RepID=UPI00097C1CE6|nr:cell division protein FtsK [Actinosynnema sp. ALI-1.44]ONI72707.1 cell division protein FtsK [Actinosynnema sp. ALI-1.44]
MTDKTRVSSPDPDDDFRAPVLRLHADDLASGGDVIDAQSTDTAQDDSVDREAIVVQLERKGAPVDPPDETRSMVSQRPPHRPIVPIWLRSTENALRTARWAAKQAGYALAFHGLRLPKYLGKVLLYAPIGLVRTAGRLTRWAMAEDGNFALRQAAAAQDDAQGWIRLDMQRERQSRWRWSLLLTAAIGVVIGAVIATDVLSGWSWWLVLAAVVAAFARIGRPADRPITDRVTEGQVYRKLTAELVRRALLSVQLGAINSAVSKDPNAITFPVEIHRDGPGHLAIVDLPYGVEAGDVCARRGRLASGLRLPLDQVWPEPSRGHTGRLALWVGHEPASQMRQPAWPLIRDGVVDVFKSFPFATDPRMNIVEVGLMFRNWLDGGQPGSGKSFALRLKVLAASLDVRAEIRGYELKGVGDFAVLEPLLTEYGNGFDDETLSRCAAMFDWLYAECQRRAKRIAHYAKLGKAPENKVTPELASLKGSGLHPLVVFVDEIQELFLSSFGKRAGEVAEKVIKLGRALGVILLIGTQIPDKDSLPTGITRNVNTRFCLSVADQNANDMILGTSAYKQGLRATAFKPVEEAGWGILSGIGEPGARRSFAVNSDDAKKVVARAIASRVKAGTMPDPDVQTRAAGPAYDVLTDVATVWPQGTDAVWNETLIERLTDYRPDVYRGWKPAQLTAALSVHRVKVGQIGRRIDGKTVTRRGPRSDDVQTAIAQRSGIRGGENP